MCLLILIAADNYLINYRQFCLVFFLRRMFYGFSLFKG